MQLRDQLLNILSQVNNIPFSLLQTQTLLHNDSNIPPMLIMKAKYAFYYPTMNELADTLPNMQSRMKTKLWNPGSLSQAEKCLMCRYDQISEPWHGLKTFFWNPPLQLSIPAFSTLPKIFGHTGLFTAPVLFPSNLTEGFRERKRTALSLFSLSRALQQDDSSERQCGDKSGCFSPQP